MTAIAAGGLHSLALKADGRVVGWGDRGWGQNQPPPRLTNAIAIAAGGFHSLALRSDGTVAAWGSTESGQTAVPNGLTNVVELAAGGFHSLARLGDGSVVAWGNNGWSQSAVPEQLSNVVGVAAGRWYSLALQGNGKVTGWPPEALGSPAVALSKAVAIASGPSWGAVLEYDGRVRLIGGEDVWPEPLTNAASISVGSERVYALRTDGTVAAWPAEAATEALRNVIAVSAGGWDSGGEHGLALLGDGAPTALRAPVRRLAFTGQEVGLNAGIVAAPPATYQWRLNGTDLPDATNAFFVLADARPADSGVYEVAVTNPLGAIAVTHTVLHVWDQPPILTKQPAGQTTYPGATISLSVEADGSPPFRYQWHREEAPIPGATNPVLALSQVPLTDSGAYSVRVENEFGSVASMKAAVSVGLVVSLGYREYDQTNVPPGLTNIVGLAAGDWHSLALRADGTVVAWGSDTFGQSSLPAGLSDVVAIAAGGVHSLALRRDGTVVAWGAVDDPRYVPVDYGQTDVPDDLVDVVAIAAGGVHGLALKSDGRVVWLGAGGLEQNAVPAGWSNVVAIAAGIGSVALLGDGSVVRWEYGPPTALPGWTNVVAVATGENRYLGLRADGTLLSEDYRLPSAALSQVVGIAGGRYHALVLLGDGRPTPAGPELSRTALSGNRVLLNARVVGTPPLRYAWFRDGIELPGETHAFLELGAAGLADSGTYTVVVANPLGTVTFTNTTLRVADGAPVLVQQPGSASGYPGGNVVFEARAEGSQPLVFQWLFNGVGIPGATNAELRVGPLDFADAGRYQVLAANAFGTTQSAEAELRLDPLVVWGAWQDPYPHCGGQAAHPPPGLTEVVAAAGGYYHTLALRADGTVVASGYEEGCGASGATLVPAGLSNVVAVAAGGYHSLALKADGTLAAWGDLGWNQMHQPPALSNVVAIAVKDELDVALLADGRVVSWGWPAYTNVPVDLGGAIAIAASEKGGAALTGEGRLALWGRAALSVGEQIADLTNVVAFALGRAHLLALDSAGQVRARGRNDGGQLDVPSELTNAVQIAVAQDVCLALKPDGTVVRWGGAGLLNPLPSLPVGLTNVEAIATGGYQFLAIVGRSPPPPPGGSPIRIVGTLLRAGQLIARIPTDPGAVYLLEATHSLRAPLWTPCWPLVLGDGSVRELTIAGLTNEPWSQRFYRVRRTR